MTRVPLRGSLALESSQEPPPEKPMAGARDCLLFIDAVCVTAAAAVATICEGVGLARDKPVVAASM
jgi:hypothetical protein